MSKSIQAGAFVAHVSCPACSSQDNLAIYQKVLEEGDTKNKPFSDEEGFYNDGFCQTPKCGYKSPEWLQENSVLDENYVPKVKAKKPFIMTDDIWEQLMEIKELGSRGWKQRNISKEVDEFYGVVSKGVTNAEGKQVLGYRYYPSTKEGKLVGYHVRNVKLKADRVKAKAAGLPKPKGAPFYPVGLCKVDCELFGQNLFNKGGRMLVIANGEEGALAAYTVLKSAEYETPCVSSMVGEGNAYLQIKNNFEFVSSFDKVIIAFDDDEAGRIGAEQVARLLKPSQAFIAKLPKGDCQDYLKAGLSKELKRLLLWDSVQYSPAGIVGSSCTLSALKERASFVKIPLPKFAEELENNLNGGFALGEITTIAAACVDSETEFLTNNGWKKISEYVEGDLVKEFDPVSRKAFWKEPLNYVKAPCSGFYHFKNKSIDQVVSPNHRMPYESYHSGVINVKTAQEIKDNHERNSTGFRGRFITTFEAVGGEGIGLSEGELRLSVAVKADGRVVKGGINNYTQMRFVKERKYNRLKEMCQKFNLKHDDRGYSDKSGQYEIIVWPQCAEKRYNDWWKATTQELLIIADEVVHWDGCLRSGWAFFGKHKEDVDFIQYAFATAGKRSSITFGPHVWQTVSASNKVVGMQAGESGKNVIDKFTEHDGYQYCFETSTGMWVARRNGKIFVTGNSSIGKTSIVNEFLYHFAFNSEYKVGVISLESDVGELTENLLSLHVNKKLANMPDEDKLTYYDSKEGIEAHRKLTLKEDGTDRYYILDHQGAVVDDSLMEKIEYLVKVLGCKIIVLDPLTLALSGKQNDGMDEFMSNLLRFVKREKIHHINVVHVRKNGSGTKANSTGADIHEEDIKGSGSIFQVSMNNILLMRDKENADPKIRNTTKVVASKMRRTGNTGPAGYWYYDNETSRLSKGSDPHGDFKADEELFEEIFENVEEDKSALKDFSSQLVDEVSFNDWKVIAS